MIRVSQVTVTGKVSGQTPLRYALGVVDVDTITVTYERDQSGEWAHLPFGVEVNGMYLDSDYTGPVDTLGPDFPEWVQQFIDTARPAKDCYVIG